MAIGQARLKPLTLRPWPRENGQRVSGGEWRRTNYFVRKIVWFGDILE